METFARDADIFMLKAMELVSDMENITSNRKMPQYKKFTVHRVTNEADSLKADYKRLLKAATTIFAHASTTEVESQDLHEEDKDAMQTQDPVETFLDNSDEETFWSPSKRHKQESRGSK